MPTRLRVRPSRPRVVDRRVPDTVRLGHGVRLESDRGGGRRHRGASKAAAFAAGLTLLLHLAANPHYGFFRDELYFIVCGQHPAFGYVDQPPLVPLAAALSQLFGPSLFLLRAVAALSAAARG